MNIDADNNNPETLTDDMPTRADEATRVAEWRNDEAMRLGFNADIAYMIAQGTFATIDLHDIENLTRAGCPATLALDILR